ncbi:hypothetical protein HN51_045282 [Arachis hypogaea]
MVSQTVELLKNEIPLEQESVVLTEATVNGLVLVDIINGFYTVGSGNLAPREANRQISGMINKSERLARLFCEKKFSVMAFLDSHHPNKSEDPYPPHFVNLTLVDLPGLTKVVVEGQQESIVQDIENMVRSYIEKPNCIILAISLANQDIATSDAIKIAREVEPSGERTFGVLTKLDLMDKRTNALDVLEGRSYRLQHPWVGIVNRSQADINRNVDMIFSRRKEREYFATSPEYGHLANKMGSEYLAKLLSQVTALSKIAQSTQNVDPNAVAVSQTASIIWETSSSFEV